MLPVYYYIAHVLKPPPFFPLPRESHHFIVVYIVRNGWADGASSNQIDPVLVLCWASVADDGPALDRHSGQYLAFDGGSF